MSTAVVSQHFSGSEGLSLAADVGGDPSHSPIVLLHGGGQTRHAWRSTMSQLISRDYHVISYDARGHGDSEWAADGNYSLGKLTADLRCLARHLSSPPILIGASMGGITSLHLSADLQKTGVAALVLVDVVPKADPRGLEKIKGFMSANPYGFESVEDAARAVAEYNPQRRYQRDPSGLMKNLRYRADGRLRWHWDPRFLEYQIKTPLTAELIVDPKQTIDVPTLLVYGSNSDIVSPAGIDDLRKSIPKLEVREVGNAGHMVVGDNNETFVEGMASFLKGLPMKEPRLT
ncbi:MAG: alpha/beta hydrolase [Hydrocarboniphaga sp.]|uniref:alpha/beta fold hydrolase n=1 Tax=Hydrocarboniphaga sp. TaxID=2033016 RepID=UPI00261E5D29|nr:alpha/beta hydrolase [Hydrocarboniphaga sp.]MDB5971170.1 alpha/beta hydrolase [Hydrocarboniphaga sp.]